MTLYKVREPKSGPFTIDDLLDAKFARERRQAATAEKLKRQHTTRFRRVSTRYPRRVAEAYGRDLERASRDSDEQVAAAVAQWEREHGVEPFDWHAIGAGERGENKAT